MEHQGQRNGEGGHHDQRIGCDEKVRRLECKKMRPSWRGHCPHGDCHDEVSDSEKAPGVCCPVRANYVSCQQRSHDDGNDARRDVSSATSARSSGVRLPFLTRLKSSGLPTATRCRIFRIMPRVAGVSGRSRTRPILLRPSPINVARWLQSRRTADLSDTNEPCHDGSHHFKKWWSEQAGKGQTGRTTQPIGGQFASAHAKTRRMSLLSPLDCFWLYGDERLATYV